MVTIQTYFDTTEAGLAQSLLESRGIPSVLLGVDTFNVVLPGGSLLDGIRLQVAEEYADEARGIVQDREGGDAHHGRLRATGGFFACRNGGVRR